MLLKLWSLGALLVLAVAKPADDNNVNNDNVIRLIGIGDWGDSSSSGQKYQKRMADAMNAYCTDNTCDAIISLGDNFYSRGVTSPFDPKFRTAWKDVYNGRAIRDLTWYMTLGNHDHYDGNEPNQLIYAQTDSQFYLPNYWYTKDIRKSGVSVSLHATDTEALRKRKYDPNRQYAETLSGLLSSSADWKIAFGHHPPVSAGRHGYSGTIETRLKPVLLEGGADLWVAGHDHNMQHITPKDTVFDNLDIVVAGAGGRGLYSYSSGNADRLDQIGYNLELFEKKYGFVTITLTSSEAHVEYMTYRRRSTGAYTYSKIYEFYKYL